MENKKYVIQWGHYHTWYDAYQDGDLRHKLEYMHLADAQDALDTVRNQSLQWRIILRIEIVLD